MRTRNHLARPSHRIGSRPRGIGRALLALAGVLGLSASSQALLEADAAAEESTFLRADKVIVRPGVELENAGVLIQRGRIVAVGPDVVAPDGAHVIEGGVVCAGFVDAWSGFGLDGDTLGEKSASFATRMVDALDPFTFDERMAQAVLRAGVTTACVQGARVGRTGGVAAVVRLPLDPALESSLLLEDGSLCMSVSSAAGSYDPFGALDLVERVVRALEDGGEVRHRVDRVPLRARGVAGCHRRRGREAREGLQEGQEEARRGQGRGRGGKARSSRRSATKRTASRSCRATTRTRKSWRASPTGRSR